MAKTYKLVYDREGCIGAGACVSACPKNWKMSDDNRADFKKDSFPEKDLDDNMEAAKACPVNVIHIEDEAGERLI